MIPARMSKTADLAAAESSTVPASLKQAVLESPGKCPVSEPQLPAMRSLRAESAAARRNLSFSARPSVFSFGLSGRGWREPVQQPAVAPTLAGPAPRRH